MIRSAILAAAAGALLAGCASKLVIEANHEGGVVRFALGAGQNERHDQAVQRALEHCRTQGFNSYTVTREYDEPGRRSIDFRCRN
jgi:hypothetical protein